jgi:hypothetical protein
MLFTIDATLFNTSNIQHSFALIYIFTIDARLLLMLIELLKMTTDIYLKKTITKNKQWRIIYNLKNRAFVEDNRKCP